MIPGFVVLDGAGDFIAWSSCPMVGKRRLDSDPLAITMERCEDGALMAYAPRSKRKGDGGE